MNLLTTKATRTTSPKATVPALKPVDLAQRIADNALREANECQAQRSALESRIAAIDKATVVIRAALHVAQTEESLLRKSQEDANTLLDLDLPGILPVIDEASLDAASAKVREVQTQLSAIDDQRARAAQERDTLTVREKNFRSEADQAVKSALTQERSKLLEDVSAARLRYLLAVREAGAWNRRNKLVGHIPSETLKLPVLPISKHTDDAVWNGIGFLDGILSTTTEVGHIHGTVDSLLQSAGLL